MKRVLNLPLWQKCVRKVDFRDGLVLLHKKMTRKDNISGQRSGKTNQNQSNKKIKIFRKVHLSHFLCLRISNGSVSGSAQAAAAVQEPTLLCIRFTF